MSTDGEPPSRRVSIGRGEGATAALFVLLLGSGVLAGTTLDGVVFGPWQQGWRSLSGAGILITAALFAPLAHWVRRGARPEPRWMLALAAFMSAVTALLLAMSADVLLDHSAGTSATSVVLDRFVLELHREEASRDTVDLCVVGLRVPPVLAGRQVALVDCEDFESKSALGRRIEGTSHPGALGWPWLRTFGKRPLDRAPDLGSLHLGKRQLRWEAELGRLVGARGTFDLGSANLRQLSDWGVPVDTR